MVVEHDEDTIPPADHLIDIGPGAGKRGGTLVAWHGAGLRPLPIPKPAATCCTPCAIRCNCAVAWKQLL